MTLAASLSTILGTAAGIAGVWLTWRTSRAPTMRKVEIGHQQFFISSSADQAPEIFQDVAEDANVPVKDVIIAFERAKRFSVKVEAAEPKVTIPPWVLNLMAPDDAQRYAWEWDAHLHQLIEEGEVRQARRDRRRLALAAVTLAIALRVRRALGRAR